MPALHSFPTRRSSDLVIVTVVVVPNASAVPAAGLCVIVKEQIGRPPSELQSRQYIVCRRPLQKQSALTLRLAGQVVIVGLVVSTTVMSAVQVVMFLAA